VSLANRRIQPLCHLSAVGSAAQTGRMLWVHHERKVTEGLVLARNTGVGL